MEDFYYEMEWTILKDKEYRKLMSIP